MPDGAILLRRSWEICCPANSLAFSGISSIESALKRWLPAQMAVNAALNVALVAAANAALNAVLNAVLLQIAKRAMGCCDQMLQVSTHTTIMLGSKGYLFRK